MARHASLSRNPLVPFLAAIAAAAVLLLAGAGSSALAAAPTLLLLAHLLTGRFPGERLLASLARRVHEARWSASDWRPKRPPLARSYGPRGGHLIGAGLSGRAPALV